MFTLNCRGQLWELTYPVVMGIINCTPDSFYAGSRAAGLDGLLETAEQMIGEGATILDIGGQSTRPGSVRVNADDELKRVVPGIKAIHHAFPEVLISIDTYHSQVAEAAVQAGASIVNDISAGTADAEMMKKVAELGTPYILMHTPGGPEDLHGNPGYENISLDVLDYLSDRTALAQQHGIRDIIVDPGFGFGKTMPENFRLLRELEVFSVLQKPILIGVSRKSTIYKSLGVKPEESLNGTTVLHTIALTNGAHILRVHDVKPAMEAIRLFRLTRGS